MRRDDRHPALPLDRLPASSLRRRDAFHAPETGEVCVVAARFRQDDGRLMLACAGEDGTLRRVVIEDWRCVKMVT